MTRTERVNVPVNADEKKKLLKQALSEGYRSLSAYLRDKGLNQQKEG